MTRRSKAEWLRLIEEHQNSGLSAVEFCRRNGVNPKYFSVRQRQLSKAKPIFVEVESRLGVSANVRVRIIEMTASLADIKSLLASLD